MKGVFRNLNFLHNPNFYIGVVLASLYLPRIYSTLLLVVGLGYGVYYGIRFPKPEKNYPLLVPIILYGWMLASYFWSISPSDTLHALTRLLPLLFVPLFFYRIRVPNISISIILKIFAHATVGFMLVRLGYALWAYMYLGSSDYFFYHLLATHDRNAVHISVFVALSFLTLYISPVKKPLYYLELIILGISLVLLSSGIVLMITALLVLTHVLFYARLSRLLRFRNLILFSTLVIGLSFLGHIKAIFKDEIQSRNEKTLSHTVIAKEKIGTRTISIQEAWNQPVFTETDFFPGTAFRVYQFRIFTELLLEDNIFWQGYGLNASALKIKQKAEQYHLFKGNEHTEGYSYKNFHNQYLQNFAELGIVGLLLLMAMLVLSLVKAVKTKNFIHISFTVLMISLFLTESFLWRQRGVIFFALLYGLFMYDTRTRVTNL